MALTTQQEKAIAALIASTSIEEAAHLCGTPRRTLVRWMALPAFQVQLKLDRRAAFQAMYVHIQAAGAEALVVLREIMHNTKIPAAPRVTAANKLVDLSFSVIPLEDLDDRLTALEQQGATHADP